MQQLIVGTGRCGTTWVAKQLRELGKRWGHEQVFGLENRFAAEQAKPKWDGSSSWLGVPYLQQALAADITVYHLVRDPLAVVASFECLKPPFERMFLDKVSDRFTRFIYRHRPEIGRTHAVRLDRIAHYYVNWTEWIFEQLGHRRVYRLETDSGRLLSEILGQEVNRPATLNQRLLDPCRILDRSLRTHLLNLRQELGYPPWEEPCDRRNSRF